MGEQAAQPLGADDPRIARAVEAYERSLDQLEGVEGLAGLFADALTSGLHALDVTRPECTPEVLEGFFAAVGFGKPRFGYLGAVVAECVRDREHGATSPRLPSCEADWDEDPLYNDIREKLLWTLDREVDYEDAGRVGEVVEIGRVETINPPFPCPEYVTMCAVVRNNRYLTFMGPYSWPDGPGADDLVELTSGSLETDPTLRELRLSFARQFDGFSSREIRVTLGEEEDIDAELRAMTKIDWQRLEEHELSYLIDEYAPKFASIAGSSEHEAKVLLRELMLHGGSYPSPEVADLLWEMWKQVRYLDDMDITDDMDPD